MADFFKKWESESDENRRLVLQEELILKVTEALYELMEEKQLNKTYIAENLGKSKAYISQLLSGSRNMTLRTLSDLVHTLNMKVDSVNFVSIDKDDHIEEDNPSSWFKCNVIDLQSVRTDLEIKSNNVISAVR